MLRRLYPALIIFALAGCSARAETAPPEAVRDSDPETTRAATADDPSPLEPRPGSTGIAVCDFFLARFRECAQGLWAEQREVELELHEEITRSWRRQAEKDPERLTLVCFELLERRQTRGGERCDWSDAPPLPAELVEPLASMRAASRRRAYERRGQTPRVMSEALPLRRSGIEATGIDTFLVALFFDDHHDELVRCYERAAERGHEPPPCLRIEWTITVRGDTEGVTVDRAGAWDGGEVGACAKAVVEGMRYRRKRRRRTTATAAVLLVRGEACPTPRPSSTTAG